MSDKPFKKENFIVLAAGIAGACGVILAAVAAHLKSEPSISTASQMLLFHASSLLGLAAWAAHDSHYAWRTYRVACIMILGVILFAGDLCLRVFYNFTPFHYAAPLGGILMILSWILISIFAFLRWIKSDLS